MLHRQPATVGAFSSASTLSRSGALRLHGHAQIYARYLSSASRVFAFDIFLLWYDMHMRHISSSNECLCEILSWYCFNTYSSWTISSQCLFDTIPYHWSYILAIVHILVYSFKVSSPAPLVTKWRALYGIVCFFFRNQHSVSLLFSFFLSTPGTVLAGDRTWNAYSCIDTLTYSSSPLLHCLAENKFSKTRQSQSTTFEVWSDSIYCIYSAASNKFCRLILLLCFLVFYALHCLQSTLQSTLLFCI